MSRGGHNIRNAGVVEAVRSLDVLALHRAGYLAEHHAGSWAWSGGARINLTGRANAIELHYHWRTGGEGAPWQPVDQSVPITWQPCRFGGVRPWFTCACSSNGRYCGRRVLKLYSAGRFFACRHCYKLVHATQRGGPMDRSHIRLARIYHRLGAEYDHFEQALPPRPKGMWRSTYARLCARLEQAEERHEGIFVAGAARLIARASRLSG